MQKKQAHLIIAPWAEEYAHDLGHQKAGYYLVEEQRQIKLDKAR